MPNKSLPPPIKLDNEIADPELFEAFHAARHSERIHLLDLLESHLDNAERNYETVADIVADLRRWEAQQRSVSSEYKTN
ncbi:hypothetical protein JEQ07_18750 [Serratia proteamaculans]|uniref:Uncharacterized protein n=1 Tax=Serratia proteamaculans TaxID=28151 RepID=A0ABS0TVT0_SERPR|nr:hypothetical protein [Serratia proteamaculans]MBI6182419.1 hypothetical protein [Serratia proteamaculans]